MDNINLKIKGLRLRSNRTLPMVIWLLSSLAISAFGQVSQPHRFERTQKRFEEIYTIISLKDEGLALLQERDKYEGSKRLWELTLLDTALHENKVVDFKVDTHHNLVGHEYSPGHIYLLFRTGDNNKNNLELFDFDLSGEQRGYYDIRPELDFKLTHFIKAGNNMIFGGYVSKDPVVLVYELATNHIRVVPGFFQKDNELVDLRANQNQTFNTVVIDRSTKTEKKLVFRTFTDGGEMLLEDIVDIDDNKSLQTSITSTLEREELMVVGTYGARQSKQSLGFFSLPVDPFNEQKIKYIDFSQLQHYFDALKPARVKRIKDSATRAKQAGRNTEFADFVMPYKIEENKNGFLLLAEVYERSSSMNQYNNNPYGSPMYGGYPSPYYYNPYMPYYYYPSRMYRPYSYGNNVRNTEEIRTTEAVLLSLDAKGNLLWDQSLKFKDVKRSALEQISDFYHHGDDVYFVFRNKENEVKVKKIELTNNEVSDTTIQIKLSDPRDEFRSEKEDVGVRKWYDNAFYTWGYQTIRNIYKQEDRVRDVFYINKIVVH